MNITLEQTVAFIILAIVMSATPGPNNIMVMTSGLNFGIKKTFAHILGVSFGCALMLFTAGIGLHTIFSQHPMIQSVIKYVGSAYLLWLAWKIAFSGSVNAEDKPTAKPITFLAAAAFQWVNPKSWVMAAGAVTTYLPINFKAPDILLFAFLFALISFPCVGIWGCFGVGLKKMLKNSKSVKKFNYLAAALLIISLYPILR